MGSPSLPAQAAKVIQCRAPNFEATIGIELGSGLGQFAKHIEDPITIPYSELPGFPVSEVDGHENQLILGKIGKVPVMCLQGRIHLYEGVHHVTAMRTMIRTLRLCGTKVFLATNASGSFHQHITPGSLVLIKDHINFNPINPLTGPNGEEFGPRFVAMDDVYDKQLRERMHKEAKKLNIDLHEGVYFAVQGPCFETPAEINAYRLLGADVIGMSTVPNVIVAKHCGLRVVVLAVITNLVCGLSTESLSHKHTLEQANLASEKCAALVKAFIENCDSD